MRQTNADLFNLHANDYVEAVADHRKLWLDNSRLKLNIQRELCQLPIDSFSDTARDSGDLLGAKATIRLGQELEARKSAQAFKLAEVAVKALMKFSPAAKTPKPSNKPKAAKKKNNNNTNSGTTNNNNQPFRGGNTQPRGGRGGGGRGRGGKSFTPKKGNKSKKGSSE